MNYSNKFMQSPKFRTHHIPSIPSRFSLHLHLSLPVHPRTPSDFCGPIIWRRGTAWGRRDAGGAVINTAVCAAGSGLTKAQAKRQIPLNYTSRRGGRRGRGILAATSSALVYKPHGDQRCQRVSRFGPFVSLFRPFVGLFVRRVEGLNGISLPGCKLKYVLVYGDNGAAKM